jgi:hypothetical protein
MIAEQLMIRIILTVMLIMILVNSYNVYRVNSRNKLNLSDLEEMTDLHPLLKELYSLVVVNGWFPLQNKIINDFIITNNIDKWLEKNREDITELIDVLKQLADKEAKNAVKDLKMDSALKKQMYDLDLKQIVSDFKEQL